MNYIYSQNPVKSVADDLTTLLTEKLSQNKRVLWLLSGGSGVPIAIAVSKKIAKLDLSNLYVTMTDERYGEIGHDNENWQQLLDAGLKLPGAHLYRPLTGQDMAETTRQFNDWLGEQFSAADYKIGIFGLGIDGHTSGIKPNSESDDMQDYAYCFVGEDYQRITTSTLAIKRLSEAFVQASGEDKRLVITDILNRDLPVDKQPAQILKQIRSATIYTNVKIGDIS